MDFFTIAQSTTPRSLRRFLADAMDDDFSRMDTSHTSHHGYKNDSILDFVAAEADAAIDNANGGDVEKAPMLSPAAEAELFMLATNFLLCKCFGGLEMIRRIKMFVHIFIYVCFSFMTCNKTPFSQF